MTDPADFLAAIGLAHAELGNDPGLLPAALASAARTYLHCDGVSLSVLALELRVPLGASDPSSGLAERAQFTTGDGPCLQAIREGVIIDATADALTQRWPMLAEAWTTQTPFRSAMSLPLGGSPSMSAALNLFFHGTEDGVHISATTAKVVTDAVSVRLGLITEANDDVEAIGAWLSAPAARRRQQVWVALGVVMLAAELDAGDALARMRSYAVTEDRSLDDVAAEIIEYPDAAGRLAP